jgi:phosphate transport system protein
MPAQHDHIVKQFDVDLRILKDKLLLMAGLVEDQISSALRALEARDASIAERVEHGDRQVNILELEIDELCVRILALRQPAASDLRFIAAALKIVTDIERVGDIAVNVAERVEALSRIAQMTPSIDLAPIGLEAQSMLKQSLDAFVRGDAAMAEKVLGRDQPVDRMFVEIFQQLTDAMKRDPQSVERCVSLIFVAKHLERIADHATNIAEMVVYLVKGKDVRHRFSVQERQRRTE